MPFVGFMMYVGEDNVHGRHPWAFLMPFSRLFVVRHYFLIHIRQGSQSIMSKALLSTNNYRFEANRDSWGRSKPRRSPPRPLAAYFKMLFLITCVFTGKS